MLKVRGLRKCVGSAPTQRVLFDGLDLDVAAGEIVAVMGESGSGKSTLLNLVAGLDMPDGGSIDVGGIEPGSLDDTRRSLFRRRHLGFVFQAFHLLPHLTIADNVALPLVITACPEAQRRGRVARALEEVGLAGRADAHPHQLSGGEMQRAAIARALIHAPQLILADEPTGNLDADNAERVLELLRSRATQVHAACLLATHSAAAARMAHRTLILAAGSLHPHSSSA
jgi:putative ABC transport system ATP-binding protein